MALLASSFVLVLVVVLERLSNPVQSVLDGGNEYGKAGGRRSRRNEADAANPAPLIPLRFEDEHEDEDEDDLI